MLVSIIIPIFQVEKHIERCLRSVMRQDYKGLIECILVDDCGKDRSVKIAEQIISEYTGSISFIWVKHAVNRGLSAARNSGTQKAKGEYIFYLDSDDEIITHAISILVEMVNKHPQVDIVYGDWYVSHKYNGLQNQTDLPEFIKDRHDICKHLLNYHMSVTAQNKLLRRQYIIENKISFLEGVIHEDVHFTFRLASTAKSIAVSHIPTYIYYLNPHGITGNYGEKDLLSILKLSDDLLNHSLYQFATLKILFISRVILNSVINIKNYPTGLKNVRRQVLNNLRSKSLKTHNFFLILYIYTLQIAVTKITNITFLKIIRILGNCLNRFY